MSAAKDKPLVHEAYIDCEGRTLWVDEVEVPDRLGREVRGRISYQGEGPQTPYSCTLAHWATMWRDKAPRWEGTT